MNLTPRGINAAALAANSSGPTRYSPVAGSGNPALALAIIGKVVHLDNSSISGLNSLGPIEQFIPMASAPRPSNVRAMEGIHVPVNVLRLSSNVMEQITGRSEFSLAASNAALIS